MLCSRFKQIIVSNSSIYNNVQYRFLIASRSISKRCFRIDEFLASIARRDLNSMSAFRLILKDLGVRRLWSVWTRSTLVHTVVRRCRRDRSVRDVLQRFRHAILSPRRTLFLSATAAFKARENDDEPSDPPRCDDNITDDEIESLLSELEGVEVLSRNTLYCTGCGKRLVIEKKHHAGVRYCMCKEPQHPEESVDGWIPYMEAEDVIIWRKEYKPGQGLFAYKVYGRYKDVRAEDFAAVQVDGAYRRVWDSAVAALSVVERCAHGVRDQAVLHWEVLWPRLFANRDYVYIRRHREFDVRTRCVSHEEGAVFASEPSEPRDFLELTDERPSVHSNAKRKAREADLREREVETFTDNKVYVIVSKSCSHPNVPESKHAIRVSEYWSHMVVKSLHGPDKVGMEFVLTYYDEPAVGGLPAGVASWATGRAAPQYLSRMRVAAAQYIGWRQHQPEQELPDYTPFSTEATSIEGEKNVIVQVSEQDMESSKLGPELENVPVTREQSTQTDMSTSDVTLDKSVDTSDKPKDKSTLEEDNEKLPEEGENNGGWWRYLYPFYYFV